MNMVGTTLGVGHPVLLDEREAPLGIEVLHDDDGAAELVDAMEKRSGAAWYSGAGDR